MSDIDLDSVAASETRADWRCFLLPHLPLDRDTIAVKLGDEIELQYYRLERVHAGPIDLKSALPIQGPPGAGKTFTDARMICELVKAGKKVGITAVSHKVIRKLLDEVVKAAGEMNLADVSCAHRKEDADPKNGPVREFGTNDEAVASLQGGAANVLGATSWLWSREVLRDSVHCLFVDEAGQMSLANVLACSPAGKNLVLLGDPQQLEQPQKGSHPEGSDISALAHLLAGQRTINEGVRRIDFERIECPVCGERFVPSPRRWEIKG